MSRSGSGSPDGRKTKTRQFGPLRGLALSSAVAGVLALPAERLGAQIHRTPGSPGDVLPGFEYPAPRYPAYFFTSHTVEELLLAAERYLKGTYKTSLVWIQGKGEPIYYYRPPRAGDVVLVVTDRTQDPVVLEALKKAMIQEGAKKVDVLYEEDVSPGRAGREGPTAAEGWREVETWEARNLPRAAGEKRPPTVQMLLRDYLEKHPEYTKIYTGDGGSAGDVRSGLGEKFAGYFLARDLQGLFSQAEPGELGALIDQKSLELFSQASEVRITDPQGTDISWRMTEAEAEGYASVTNRSGHLLLNPYRIVSSHTGMVVPGEVNGIIAGTANHYGFFPHIAVHVRGGQVVKVDGGGEYGRRWREWLEKTKDLKYPGHRDPGYFYLFEIALGTAPKAARPPTIFQSTISDERRRSGVIHFGFGIEFRDHPLVKEFEEFAAKQKVPYGHWWHVHTYFNTIELKLRLTVKWIKVVDKGWITLYDDPEVRKVASRFGDPEKMFSYDWVPAIPGINYPGDYWKDYASDPAGWAKKEFAMYKLMVDMMGRKSSGR